MWYVFFRLMSWPCLNKINDDDATYIHRHYLIAECEQFSDIAIWFQSITCVRSHAIGFNTCMTWPKMFQCDGSLSLKLTLSVPRSSHVFSSIALLNCSLLKSDNVRGQISGHQMNASVYLNPETSVLTCLRTKTEEKDCV